MGMNSEIKNYWNAVADKSEYVGGYLELGIRMLLKVCTDRRMFCKMTRWDPETAAANVAAQRELRLKREAAAREKEQADRLQARSREVVKVLPQYQKTAKCQAYQKEYQRRRRAKIKKEKKG